MAQVVCNSCGASREFADHMAGLRVLCKACSRGWLQVPGKNVETVEIADSLLDHRTGSPLTVLPVEPPRPELPEPAHLASVTIPSAHRPCRVFVLDDRTVRVPKDAPCPFCDAASPTEFIQVAYKEKFHGNVKITHYFKEFPCCPACRRYHWRLRFIGVPVAFGLSFLLPYLLQKNFEMAIKASGILGMFAGCVLLLGPLFGLILLFRLQFYNRVLEWFDRYGERV